MHAVQATSLILGFGLVALAFSSRDASGRAKKPTRHSHSHSHSHDADGGGHAGHAHSSPYTFGLGLTMSQGFGEESSAEGGSEESHGHSHGLRDAHDDAMALTATEGESEDEGGSSGPAMEISLNGGYRLSKRVSMSLGLGFSPDAGIGDPTVGSTYTAPLQKRLSLGTTLSASVPLSDESKETYKITTISLSADPTLRRGKFNFAAKAKVSKSYYSKTIIVEEEEEEETATPLRLRGLALQDEHDHEEGEVHEVESADAGTGEREFDRYGLSGNVAYALARRWTVLAGLGVSLVTYQFGDSKIETNATIIQGTYTWKSMSGTVGLLTTGTGESFTMPTQPGVMAGVFYLYE